MSEQIEIEGLKDVEKALTELNKMSDTKFNMSLAKIGYKIKALAQNRLTERKHIKTSRVKNSIFVQCFDKTAQNSLHDNNLSYSWDGGTGDREMKTLSLRNNEIAIGTNVEYAAAIERGAAPHIIEVKKKKVLSNGKQFFGRRVNHPGFGGDSFLYWAAKNLNIDFASYFRDVVNQNRKLNNTL